MVEAKNVVIVIAVAVAIAGLVVFVSKQPGGYIQTKGGSTCSWRTDGNPTTGRSFAVDCSCSSDKEYSCKYVANPDTTCPKFNKDVIGFFRQIRDAISASDHGCDLKEFTIPLCEEYKDFKIKRVGNPSPAAC